MSTAAKEKLKKALIHLSEEESLDLITVKDICERAELSRRTFYNYYHDILALMEEILSDVAREITERGIRAKDAEAIVRVFTVEMANDYEVLMRVLGSRYRAQAELHLLLALKKILPALYQASDWELSVSEEERDFLIDISACMLLTYFLEHYALKDITAEEITQKFLWLIENLISSAK